MTFSGNLRILSQVKRLTVYAERRLTVVRQRLHRERRVLVGNGAESDLIRDLDE
jgi:hypothetical protein